MRAIRPYIDGNTHRGNDKYILRADLDNNIGYAPNQNGQELLSGGNIYMRKFVPLGLTLPELIQLGVENNPQLLMESTTLKTKEAGVPNFAADIDYSGTTGQIEVRAFGIRYTAPDLLDKMISRVYGNGEGRRIELRDPNTNRDFSFTWNPKQLGSAYFDSLVGGNNQTMAGGVQVDRFFRWARNSVATTPNQEYDMNYSSAAQVATSDQALSDPFNFKSGIPNTALVMYDRLGLNPSVDHSEFRAKTNQQYVMKELLAAVGPSTYNAGVITTSATPASINHLEFGRITTIGPTITFADHQFKPLPMIKPIFASGEQLNMIILDNGTPIAAGTSYGAGDMIVATGWLIQTPEYASVKPAPLG